MITNFDFQILDWIAANCRCAALDVIAPALSFLAEGGIFWILLGIVLLCIPKTRKAGLALAIAIVLNLALCNGVVKPLVDRLRPYELRPDILLIVSEPIGPSFPSGHTSASFSCAGALLFAKNRLGVPTLILAALIGLSRLYLYVHFPTDVIAGALLGLLCGFWGTILEKKWAEFRQKRKS